MVAPTRHTLQVYSALFATYVHETKAMALATIDTMYKDYWLEKPTPVLRVDGKLQLETRTEYITTRAGTRTGIALKLFGRTSANHSRLLRRENVPHTMSKAKQLRILRAMCDIVAVQEQADYKLVKALKALPAHKEHLRPKKGKYG